jgi:Flp pilus assembly pilin Flp
MTPNETPANCAGAEEISRLDRTRYRLYSRLYSLHKKEDGIEAVETIIILVVAVIVLLALISYFWPSVFTTLKNKISELFSSSPGGP